MAIRKHTVDGIEYNMLTDEELEELMFVAALEEKCKLARENVSENYIPAEEFFKERNEFYGL